MHSMSGVQHPANMLPPLGRFLEEAVDFVATCPTHDALSFWAERLRSVLQLAEEFAPRQRQLLASCDAHVARINAKKRTLLLKRVLQTVGYQDTAIADELAAGFPLFGAAQASTATCGGYCLLRAHGPSVAGPRLGPLPAYR